jgi:hypothetical protein
LYVYLGAGMLSIVPLGTMSKKFAFAHNQGGTNLATFAIRVAVRCCLPGHISLDTAVPAANYAPEAQYKKDRQL